MSSVVYFVFVLCKWKSLCWPLPAKFAPKLFLIKYLDLTEENAYTQSDNVLAHHIERVNETLNNNNNNNQI